MNSLRLSRLSRSLRPPAGILLATLGLAGALASPAVSAADSLAELFDGRLPNNSQHAPYFHNGIAANLTEAVHHYEVALGFQYTKQEREDLVAFLEAL